jgi:hypothetical protein
MRSGHREAAPVETMEIGASQPNAEVVEEPEVKEVANADEAASSNVEATEIEAPEAEQIATTAKTGKADTDPALVAEAAIIFSVVRPQARHIERLKAAQKGEMPGKLDFSADTHAPYRKRLAAIEAAIEAGNVALLEGYVKAINPRSSSPRALLAFASLALVALKARQESCPA